MKPRPFELHTPASIEEAAELKSRYGPDAQVLAGGQSLVPLMNMRLAAPAALIDLNRVEELAYINRHADELRVGSMTRQRALERAPEADACPLVRVALRHVAHTAIRNRGTIGGSIAHADPAAELPATLAALDGSVVAISVRGSRVISASQLFQFHFTTCLEPDEIITEVRWPHLAPGDAYAFLEVARRHGDFALAGTAAIRRRDRWRLAFCGVGATPVVVDTNDPDEAAASVSPTDDIHCTAAHRRRLVKILTTRAVQQAEEVTANRD